MRAVITVVGKDTVGIFAKVSTFCADHNVNIVGVSQTILEDNFCMIMLVEVDEKTTVFGEFADAIQKDGEENGLMIHAMHEDIFNSMHKI